MRKTQKKQTDELLALLGQVHKGIRQMIQAGKSSDAMDLLSQCQDAAINLGETIEQSEGEGFVTVTCLEAYCESVYQIYETLRQGQHIQAEKAYKHLHKALTKVKNSVNNDIKVRTEAVFLPYKASMWDSLESVWKAADEDPDCDAYVIPIPYYDKNPDGSFREEHYEGDLYPDYVPVTRYQDYDLAEHCPDLIFIHNPYDECNYVTSVHPFFYSKNLKQYTEKLVYIPYFILGEIDPEDTAAVKGMEHFCTTPAVIHADKVIVQSEAMRMVYVNVMTEFAKENGMPQMDRKYWEEKILGLGSPKVDKVLNTRREDLEIPEEWLRIIEKPDGSWKKIIFYNTTVTAFLKHGEQYLEKMRDVFRVFYENREDVALLWRPHPLMEATVESMRPELAKEYQEIVREYQEAGWGIYDESAELERAIGVSDAYYGDWSSVVQIYQEVKKPIMIKNVNAVLGKQDIISFDNISDNSILFSASDNGIYRYVSSNHELQLLSYVPFNGLLIEFNSSFAYNNKIFLVPFAGHCIMVYDQKNNEYRNIDFPYERNWRGNYFSGVKKNGRHLYFMPCAFNKVFYLDMDTEEIYILQSCIEEEEGVENRYFSEGYLSVEESKLIFGKIHKNEKILVDIRKGRVEKIPLQLESEGWGSICGDKDGVWYIPYSVDRIFYYDRKQNKYVVFRNFPKGFIPGKASFVRTCLVNGKLYLIPGDANMFLIVDTDGKIVAPFGIDVWNSNNSFEKIMRYSNAWKENNRIKIFIRKTCQIADVTNPEHVIFENIRIVRKYNVPKIKHISESILQEKECTLSNVKAYLEAIKENKTQSEIHKKVDMIQISIYQKVKDE